MEHFIDAVRQYPCLWNTAAIEYRDQELKDAAWAELMKETDLSSVKEVKLKWKKLRDSYRDALKRQAETPAGGKRPAPWKYTAHMQFLQPHMSNRKNKPGDSPPQADARDSDAERSSGERRATCACAISPRRRRPRPDPLHAFFSGMCEATRRLPAHAQIHIKKTLFGAVIAAEEALVRAAAASSSSSESHDDKPL